MSMTGIHSQVRFLSSECTTELMHSARAATGGRAPGWRIGGVLAAGAAAGHGSTRERWRRVTLWGWVW